MKLRTILSNHSNQAFVMFGLLKHCIILLISFIGLPLDGKSYCTNPYERIYRQSQLDSIRIIYPNCSYLDQVTLFFDGIKNLESLSYLKSIKRLTIHTTDISSLKGIENVRISTFQLSNCPNLQNLDLFPKIDEKGSVVLENLKIKTLPKLSHNELNFLSLLYLDSLTNVDKISIASGGLIVEACNKLSIANACKKFGKLSLLRIDKKLNLFDKIPKMEIRFFEMTDCNNISNLEFIDSIYGVENIAILSNDNLSICATDKICSLINSGASVFFDKNAPGCLSLVEVKSQCVSASTSFDIERINIYPNPTFNNLVIDTDIAFDRIIIYDLSGKNLIELANNDNLTDVNVSGLNAGIYILRLVDSNGDSVVRKFEKI